MLLTCVILVTCRPPTANDILSRIISLLFPCCEFVNVIVCVIAPPFPAGGSDEPEAPCHSILIYRHCDTRNVSIARVSRGMSCPRCKCVRHLLGCRACQLKARHWLCICIRCFQLNDSHRRVWSVWFAESESGCDTFFAESHYRWESWGRRWNRFGAKIHQIAHT